MCCFTKLTVFVTQRLNYLLLSILCVLSVSSVASDIQTPHTHQPSHYFTVPDAAKPLSQNYILVYLDQSHDMLKRAYPSKVFQESSDDGREGYFEASKQYRYHVKEQYFEEDSALTRGEKDAWDGRFLNWLLMRKLDMVSLLLLGIDTQSKQPHTLASNATTDNALIIKDPQSWQYSPVPGFANISIQRGKLRYLDKTLVLRINKPRAEKGLHALMSPSNKLFFYSAKSIPKDGKLRQHLQFGKHDELVEFLKTWRPSQQAQTQIQYQASNLSAFENALEQLKKLDFQSKEPLAICQQYTHVSVSHSTFPSLQIKDALVEDCQPEIKGKQPLKRFTWLANQRPGSNKRSPKQQEQTFTFAEKDALLVAIINSVFTDNTLPLVRSKAYQVSGADLGAFPDGSAVLYQSLSKYALANGSQTVNWLGDLRAIFVDKQGRMRSDNGNKMLGEVSEDPIISSCFDKVDQQLRFRFLQQEQPQVDCNRLNYPYLEKDVGYLWQASELLNKASHYDITSQRLPFNRSEHKRYIRTHLGQQAYDFVADKRFPLKPEYLKIPSQKALDRLINYVRGEDHPSLRSRQLANKHYILGDTFQQTPIVVGKPSANHHLLYGDPSYHAFLKQYQQRRTRIFVASNSGMLHSFNGGWFDTKKQQLNSAQSHLNQWHLGQEIWAFVPQVALPYLKEISDRFYGISPEHHLQFFAQKPYVFDAKVFGKTGINGQKDRLFKDQNGQQLSLTTHPEGWGTLMVVGFGVGEALGDDFMPSFLVFDITDAEQAPKFLASIRAPNMKSATSLPSVMTYKDTQDEMQWHLVIGSGFDLEPATLKQQLSSRMPALYSYNLKDITSKSPVVPSKTILLNAPSAVVSGIASADWNLDSETDALYVNMAKYPSSQGNKNSQSGSVFRVNIRHQRTQQLEFRSEQLLSTAAPVITRPQLSLDPLDNRWIFLASKHDVKHGAFNVNNSRIIGIKEPRNALGDFLVDKLPGNRPLIQEQNLLDVSKVLVDSVQGTLSGELSIKSELSEPTVQALEHRMTQFTEPAKYINGWARHLDKGEMPNGESRLLGGILSQATHQSHYAHCQLSSHAYIHDLRFTTGTAWYSSLLNKANYLKKGQLQDTKTPSEGADTVNTIMLHYTEDASRQIQTSKNGNTRIKLEEDRHIPISSEISWREL